MKGLFAGMVALVVFGLGLVWGVSHVHASPQGGGGTFVNPGFETGSFTLGWVVDGTGPAPVVTTSQHHSGSFSAQIGNVEGTETMGNSSIYQQFFVPASGGILSFWYYPSSNDKIIFDWQDVYLTDLSGTVLTTIKHVCENTQAWTNVKYDLASYAGQTVRLKFLVHSDGFGDLTSMYVDDVALTSPTWYLPLLRK